ncbi:SH3 domain-containing protein [Pseudodonghicola flavimaris]|uniref:SH3 domain-containing protein n=1 Tax=Pseudodonghicola flavimaris TaxID=3050036 RepID=A0ABT7F1H4_9RHOB|nr:SH3 domain-containing protein [Pseudodonghicola flavimaris]MDK3018460.1 SH3 domain-containing protein [Pseudodonghicola flavimaris]
MFRKLLAPLLLSTSLALGAVAAHADSYLYVRDGVTLNARGGPGTRYVAYQMLRPGTRVTMINRLGDWAQVRTPEGALLWVFASYLMTTPSRHIHTPGRPIILRPLPVEQQHRYPGVVVPQNRPLPGQHMVPGQHMTPGQQMIPGQIPVRPMPGQPTRPGQPAIQQPQYQQNLQMRPSQEPRFQQQMQQQQQRPQLQKQQRPAPQQQQMQQQPRQNLQQHPQQQLKQHPQQQLKQRPQQQFQQPRVQQRPQPQVHGPDEVVGPDGKIIYKGP